MLNKMNLFTKRLLYLIVLIGIVNDLKAQIITIKNQKFAYKEIELAYHFADGVYQLKKIRLNESGFALFQNVQLESGLYYIYFNDSTFTKFLYDAKDSGKITINYNTETTVYETTGPETTEQYNNFLISLNALRTETKTSESNTLFRRKKNKTNSENQYILFSNQKDSLIDHVLPELRSTFLKAFLLAQRNVSIPDYTPPENVTKKDSAIWNFQMNYYKKHYLDNVDLTNNLLIHTPVYTEKIRFFLDIISAKNPEDLAQSVDFLIEKSSSDSLANQFMLTFLLDKYERNKNNAIDEYVYLHIIEKYYLHSGDRWISNHDLSMLNREYSRRKPSSLRESAPDFVAFDIANKNLSLTEIEGDIILLYFMSYECPICDKVTPEIKKLLYRFYYLDIKVVALCVGENTDQWRNYIKKKGIMNWINLFGGDQMSKIALKYNLSYTPTLFLLNKDKIITHKNLNTKQLDDILLRIAVEQNK